MCKQNWCCWLQWKLKTAFPSHNLETYVFRNFPGRNVRAPLTPYYRVWISTETRDPEAQILYVEPISMEELTHLRDAEHRIGMLIHSTRWIRYTPSRLARSFLRRLYDLYVGISPSMSAWKHRNPDLDALPRKYLLLEVCTIHQQPKWLRDLWKTGTAHCINTSYDS